jgi:transcriptional regulator with XRE-family HTH domain
MVLTKLTEILKNREMSDEQLAVKTMLTVRSIQNAKKGRGVSLNTSKRIAKGLKLTLKELEG